MSAKRINKCKDVENMLQNKDRNVLKTDRERERAPLKEMLSHFTKFYESTT